MFLNGYQSSRSDSTTTWRSLTVLFIACFACGCSSSQPAAEPVDVPKTVSELVDLQQKIKQYCEGNTDVNGHDALHEIGDTLGTLKKLDATSGLSESQRDEIAVAAESMLQAYGDLDGAIHEGTEFDYNSIADTIDDAVAKVQANTTPQTP